MPLLSSPMALLCRGIRRHNENAESNGGVENLASLRECLPVVVILDSEPHPGAEPTDACVQKIREDLMCIWAGHKP